MHSAPVRHFSMCLVIGSGLGLALVTATTPAAASPADPITGYIYDNILYQQTSNSAPTTPEGYFFDMGYFFTNPGDYTTGTVSYPGPGSPQTLPVLPGSNNTQYDFQSGLFSSMSALHAAYPFGHYTITASGGSAGTEKAHIDYKHDYFTTTTPYVTNYSSLNGLNTAANFSVDYDSFTPNSRVSAGFTFFTITDASTGAAVYTDDFQDPSSMSALILADTLSPDTTYDYELDFSDRLNGYNNGSGVVYHARV